MVKEPQIDVLKSKIKFGVKLWLEFEDTEKKKNILGSGWSKLLKSINNMEYGSLTRAAQECGYSYKYAWNILKRIEKRTGMSPVISSKGGSGGGGYVKLNEWGEHLLKIYSFLFTELEKIKKNIGDSLKIS